MAKTYNFDEIIPREQTNCVKYDFRKAYFGTEDILPMWVADMDFRTPDFIVNSIFERASHEIYGYGIQTDSFYNSAIDWVERKHNWTLQRNWISFSPGVVPAMAVALTAFTQPGDKIIVQPPVYFPFFTTIIENNREMVVNPLRQDAPGRYRMDIEDLKEKIDARTRMIFLCNPHNPVGRVWEKEELQALADVCVEHNIIIFSDEIHSDLIFSGHKHIPIASLSEEVAKITCTAISPSKTFNIAGLSAALCIIPDNQLRGIYKKRLDAFHLWLGNIFGTAALEAAYREGEEWLSQLLDYLENNSRYVQNYFAENIPQIKVIQPEGTYLMWLDCRKLHLPGNELKQFFIEIAKVGLNDGAVFGVGGEGFQRLNIGSPFELVKEACERIGRAVKSL